MWHELAKAELAGG